MVTMKQKTEFFDRFGEDVHLYWSAVDGFLLDKFRRALGLGKKQSVASYVNRNYGAGSWELIMRLICSNEVPATS